jgi:hypothetical protein
MKMTLESLTHNFLEYVSWLYRVRPWAGWELATLAAVVLALFLLIVRSRRKAGATRKNLEQTEEYARALVAMLTTGKVDHQDVENSNGRHFASLARKDGKKRGWRQTTEEWRNFGTLVEELRREVAQYKQAEENFKQQLAKLKAANERLQQELAGKAIVRPDLGGAGPIARFSTQQDRMLDAR